MGEQHVLAEALVVATDPAVRRSAGQLGAQLVELAGEGEWHEAGAGREHVVAELPGDLVAEAGSPHRRNRQAAGGDDQRRRDDLPDVGAQQVSGLGLLDLLHRSVQPQVNTTLPTFVQEHFEDVPGPVVAEQLAQFLLVVGHAVPVDHRDEVPLGVAGQSGLDEMRVLREEVGRLRVDVGEVAAATTGHEDLLARLVGVLDEQHLAAAFGGRQGAHQTGGTCADDHNVGGAHNSSSITVEGWIRAPQGKAVCSVRCPPQIGISGPERVERLLGVPPPRTLSRCGNSGFEQ